MRIISQDKNHSIDFTRAHIWKQYGCIYGCVKDKNIVLGNYATDERALEVFLDMHNAYSPVDLITVNMTEEQASAFIGSVNVSAKIVGLDNTESEITLMQTGIYYMPDE